LFSGTFLFSDRPLPKGAGGLLSDLTLVDSIEKQLSDFFHNEIYFNKNFIEVGCGL
jgi:hypothetical protein